MPESSTMYLSPIIEGMRCRTAAGQGGQSASSCGLYALRYHLSIPSAISVFACPVKTPSSIPHRCAPCIIRAPGATYVL
jgi:hypothetical protein